MSDEALIKTEMRTGVCSGGIPMSIVNNCEAGKWLRYWRGSDGKVDPEGYLRLLQSHEIVGDITLEDVKQYCRARFGDDI